jgi:hypothetical protein
LDAPDIGLMRDGLGMKFENDGIADAACGVDGLIRGGRDLCRNGGKLLITTLPARNPAPQTANRALGSRQRGRRAAFIENDLAGAVMSPDGHVTTVTSTRLSSWS